VVLVVVVEHLRLVEMELVQAVVKVVLVEQEQHLH
jgi:hypothetical protein